MQDTPTTKAKRPAGTGRRQDAESSRQLLICTNEVRHDGPDTCKGKGLFSTEFPPPPPRQAEPTTDTEPAYSTRRNGQQAGDFSQSERTPLQAIRAFCLECVCGQRSEVDLCPATQCPLYGYRYGVRPSTAQAAGKQVRP